jgi:hypothetical protein
MTKTAAFVHWKLEFVCCLVLIICCSVAFSGCDQGPPAGKVRGKVTFKGKPVAEGLVTFINPKEGGAAEAYLNSDGTYAVGNRVPVGDYQVMITPLTEMKDTDPGKTPPMKVEKNAPDVPRKYRMPGSTPLKATVVAGENEFNFDMMP